MKTATITVSGSDRAGIIARTTTCLYEAGANILALDEKVVAGIFSMTLNADVSKVKIPKLRKDLATVGNALGLDVRVKLRDTQEKKNLALLVSREDHCLRELVKQCRAGKIRAKPVVIIGNHPDLKSIAQKLKLPFRLVADKVKADREKKMIQLFKRYDTDFIALARYMQILSPELVARYEGRVINIHPSLLPSFPGARPYHQAVEAGVTVAGVTANFVTTDLDRGPVIEQAAFRVGKKDTPKKITLTGQKLEAKVLAKACELYSKDKLYLHWGKVYFK